MHYKTEITGEDVPKTADEWSKLTMSELAVQLTRDGMLTLRGNERAEYLRIQLAQVRTNLIEARLEQQFTVQNNTLNVYGGSDKDLEDERSALIAHIRDELGRRGVDLTALDRIGLHEASELDSPPEAG